VVLALSHLSLGAKCALAAAGVVATVATATTATGARSDGPAPTPPASSVGTGADLAPGSSGSWGAETGSGDATAPTTRPSLARPSQGELKLGATLPTEVRSDDPREDSSDDPANAPSDDPRDEPGDEAGPGSGGSRGPAETDDGGQAGGKHQPEPDPSGDDDSSTNNLDDRADGTASAEPATGGAHDGEAG
jgi:hypothetical protein